MTTVLVTGANGFIGSMLCPYLLKQGFRVKAVTRQASVAPALMEAVEISDINADTDWTEALKNVDVIIHLAARVHVMRERSKHPLQDFRQVNTFGTENLARQAAAVGVKRFIFLSTVKVLGESSGDQAFTWQSKAAPQDLYALSKWEAEQLLHSIAFDSGMEYVVIRPPLVYGPGVRGNFLRLIHGLKSGFPMPVASSQNRRSFVYVENLCDLIAVCVNHRQAVGQTLLVADLNSYSTAELITLLANALQLKARILPIPLRCLQYLATLVGKQSEIKRLCHSLEVDVSETKRLLAWQAPFTTEQGLAKTVANLLS